MNFFYLSGDPDIFVSQSEKTPSLVKSTWNSCEAGKDEIRINLNDPLFDSKKGIIFISVKAHKQDCSFNICVSEGEVVNEESLKKSSGMTINKNSFVHSEKPGDNYEKCDHCDHYVPIATITRHKIFCERNNYVCEICKAVLSISNKQYHWHCPICTKTAQPDDHFHCGLCKHVMNKEEKEEESHVHCEKCNKPMNKSQLQKHMEISHSLIKCDCGSSFELESLKVHKEFECSHRLTHCIFCTKSIRISDKKQHETICGSKSTSCPYCSNSFPFSKLDEHLVLVHSDKF